MLVRDMMCVKPGESVLITTDTDTDRVAVQAVQDAAYRSGGKVGTITLAPPLPFQGTLADPYLPDHVKAATNACDVWIDLCMPYLAGSKAFDIAVHNNRTRYFLGGDMGSEALTRLMGMVDLDELLALGDAFAAVVAGAVGKECRITAPPGTDVTFVLAKPEGLALTRAATPGGYYIPGTVLMIPELESVRGTVVTRHFFHEYYTEVAEPIIFTIDGKVRDVTGGGSENKVMRRSLARAGHGGFGHVVHFTCGIHPAARCTGKCFNEDLRVMGANAVGLGTPNWMPGGGENHPDCVFQMQSIWIDGKPLVRDGIIIGPPHVRALAESLLPIFT